MPQRSLSTYEERAEADAVDLSVEHRWPDHGYPTARLDAIGDDYFLHVDTPAGRYTALFAKIDTVEDVIIAVLEAVGLSESHELVVDSGVLTPITRTLVSVPLTPETVAELRAV